MKNHYVITFLFCVSLTLLGMDQDSKSNINEQLEDKYDCEKLKAKFPHLKDTKRRMNSALRAFLRGDLEQQKKFNYYSYIEKINAEFVSEQMACLICLGANPNIVAGHKFGRRSKNRYYRDPKKVEQRNYTCPLEYAVEADDENLVRLLLEHGVKTNVDRITWLASIKDNMLNRPRKKCDYLMTERIEKLPLLFRIRSVQVAKLLVPHIGTQDTADGYTVAHHLAGNRTNDRIFNIRGLCFVNDSSKINDELLEYYLETTGLANTIHPYTEELPLHRLASRCGYYTVPEMQKKASLLISKTRNIDAVNAWGRTSLDIANRCSHLSCRELARMLKVNSGERVSNM